MILPLATNRPPATRDVSYWLVSKRVSWFAPNGESLCRATADAWIVGSKCVAKIERSMEE
jgi:hypothetical protein